MQHAQKAPPLDPRDVIAEPETYSDCPALYAEAWFALKSRQGLPVDYPRAAIIGPPRHNITHPAPTPDPEPTARDILNRCAGKARKIGLARGIIGNGGDAA